MNFPSKHSWVETGTFFILLIEGLFIASIEQVTWNTINLSENNCPAALDGNFCLRFIFGQHIFFIKLGVYAGKVSFLETGDCGFYCENTVCFCTAANVFFKLIWSVYWHSVKNEKHVKCNRTRQSIVSPKLQKHKKIDGRNVMRFDAVIILSRKWIPFIPFIFLHA